MSDDRPPQAPVTVVIDMHADSWPQLIQALENEIAEAERINGGKLIPHVWGGAGSAGHVEVYERDVSVKQYHQELQEWHRKERR